jgi:S-adenosylmethionine-diacylglycerol 3-amino-3-carboxypropyl transferase
MEQRVKFAVVREDPALEAELIRLTNARTVLVVASGGCTALTLKRQFPSVDIFAFDPDPLQLAHVRAKAEAAARGDLYALSVGDAHPDRLNQRGEVEGVFRVLRRCLLEFVLTSEAIEIFFQKTTTKATRAGLCADWFGARYWPTAFNVAFAHPLLEAVLGPRASRRDDADECARHFQRVFERGLRAPNAGRNPFLQHTLLGCYYYEDAPLYARTTGPLPVRLIHGELADVPDLRRFDVISLSSLLDGLDDSLVERCAKKLADEVKPGCAVLLRQKTTTRDLRPLFAPAFAFDDALGTAFQQKDRSFMFDRVEVATRTALRMP